MRLRTLCLFVLCLVPVMAVHAADTTPAFSVGFSPAFALPCPWDANAQRFAFLAGARVSADYILPSFPMLYANAGIEYGYNALNTTGTIYDGVAQSISMFSVIGGVGLRFPVTDWLTLRLLASGGYYFGVASLDGVTGGSGFVAGGLGAGFRLGPSLSLGVLASYRMYVDLLQTFDVGVGVSYAFGMPLSAPAAAAKGAPAPADRPGPLKEVPVQPNGKSPAIRDLSFDPVFPIFHAYYDTHPVGHLTLRNDALTPVTDVVVSLFIRQYMDAAKECVTIPSMKPGEERAIDLVALFKNSILDVTEATKVAAEITVAYTQDGQQRSIGKTESIRVFDRNALTWDDNRKAAAFVTSKDPAILVFSNNVNVAVKPKMNRALDRNLQMGIALHDALRLYGIGYVSNPLTPYATVSRDKLAVDTLKFPRQTLEYHSGDCSDLSLLYCALLESVQIETAFVTIPGHIFMAFALTVSPEDARAAFSHPDELIFRNDKAWVPVEVTERDGTFLTAWQEGAAEWRENLAKKQADFYPLHEAWKTYEPVGLPGSGNSPSVPDAAKIVLDFQADVSRQIDLEIYERVASLQAAVAKTKESPKAVNSLGVLYARYDLQQKAETQFRSAVAKEEFVPALVNLGNLCFIRRDLQAALSFYQRASRKAPEDPNVLLGLARVNQELENYGTVRDSYQELKKVAPKLAQQFAYLELKGEESVRAADISGAKELTVWDE